MKEFRLIALASRYISEFDKLSDYMFEKLTDEELQIEKYELKFEGLLVFENKLKKKSSQVVSNLKNAMFQVKIISGDSPFTTAMVARELGIIDKQKEVVAFTIELNGEKHDKEKLII